MPRLLQYWHETADIKVTRYRPDGGKNDSPIPDLLNHMRWPYSHADQWVQSSVRGFLHQCFIVSTDFKHTVFKLEVWERQPISLVVDEERRCQGDTFIAGGQYCDFPELH